MKAIVPLYLAWLATAVMLVLAVSGTIRAPTSYRSHTKYSRAGYGHTYAADFYTALRWVSCAAFSYSLIVANHMQLAFWSWIFSLLAFLFNPIIPLYFQRQTWHWIDYSALVVIVLAGTVFWRNRSLLQSTVKAASHKPAS